MEPVFVAIVVCALVAVRTMALRRAGPDRPRVTTVLLLAPLMISLLLAIVAGALTMPRNPAMGLTILAFFTFTAVLVVRLVFTTPSRTEVANGNGDLPRPWLDFFVWMGLGAPVLLGAVLVVLAITGGLAAK